MEIKKANQERTSKNRSLLDQESPKAVAFGQRLKGRQRSGKTGKLHSGEKISFQVCSEQRLLA